MKTILARRSLLLSAFGTSLLSSCLWPRFFDIAWEEEVQLRDGRITLAGVKYTYERLSNALLDRYDRAILRNTELSFDAGPGIGRFTQLFKKHRVNAIEQVDGHWYLLLQTRGEAAVVKTESGWKEEWGAAQSAAGHKCVRLDKTGIVMVPLKEMRSALRMINLLMDYAPIAELAALNGTRVTVSQKALLLARYPLHPSDLQLASPNN